MKAKERKTTSRFRYPTSLRSRVSEYSVFLGLSTYIISGYTGMMLTVDG
ncbi:hypothetical protein QUB69_30565 [Microcoleus sp. AT13-A6]